MESLNDDLNEYRNQLDKGAIQRAYRALLDYLLCLRSHFDNPGVLTQRLGQRTLKFLDDVEAFLLRFDA